jgi:hypothetical protein
MANNFASLKTTSSQSIEKLNTELEKLNPTQQSRAGDDRFWKPTVDKAGNGYAVIRFLPASSGEDVPFVRVFSHGFQGPGGWYIENSLTTINQKDPVGEMNQLLWNTGGDEGKEQARKQKRKLEFVSNIYVVKDPSNPANEGKVFLYKFGKKIWDKINLQMNPEFEDESPVNPFDFWQGADFKLKIRKVAGYRNYDSSEFDSSAPLLDDDVQLEAIWNKQYALQEFVDPKNFKSYDELNAKLNRVLGKVAPTTTAEETSIPQQEEETTSWTQSYTDETESAPLSQSPQADSDDDDIAFFKSLAEED